MATPINVNTQIPASQLRALQDVGIYADNAKSANKPTEEAEISDVADFELDQTTSARFGDLLGQVDGSEESLSELATMVASTPKELVAIASGDFSEVAEVQAFNQALASARSLASNPEADVSQDEVIDLAAAMVLGRNAPGEARASSYPQLTTSVSSMSGTQVANLQALLQGTFDLSNYTTVGVQQNIKPQSHSTGTKVDEYYVIFDLEKLSKDTGVSVDVLKKALTGTRQGAGYNVNSGYAGNSQNPAGFVTYFNSGVNGGQNTYLYDTIKNDFLNALKGTLNGVDGLKDQVDSHSALSRMIAFDYKAAKEAFDPTEMNVADLLIYVNVLRMRMQEDQIKGQVLDLKANVASAEALGKLKSYMATLRAQADGNAQTVPGNAVTLANQFGISLAFKENTNNAADGTNMSVDGFSGKDQDAKKQTAKEHWDRITQEIQTRIDSMNSTQQIQMISLQKWNSTRNESGETASNFLSKFQQLNSQIISKIGQ